MILGCRKNESLPANQLLRLLNQLNKPKKQIRTKKRFNWNDVTYRIFSPKDSNRHSGLLIFKLQGFITNAQMVVMGNNVYSKLTNLYPEVNEGFSFSIQLNELHVLVSKKINIADVDAKLKAYPQQATEIEFLYASSEPANKDYMEIETEMKRPKKSALTINWDKITYKLERNDDKQSAVMEFKFEIPVLLNEANQLRDLLKNALGNSIYKSSLRDEIKLSYTTKFDSTHVRFNFSDATHIDFFEGIILKYLNKKIVPRKEDTLSISAPKTPSLLTNENVTVLFQSLAQQTSKIATDSSSLSVTTTEDVFNQTESLNSSQTSIFLPQESNFNFANDSFNTTLTGEDKNVDISNTIKCFKEGYQVFGCFKVTVDTPSNLSVTLVENQPKLYN
ncbi:MAG: hypothetical protein H0W64_05505 [Gammaproteobacteria bacterium]|nr:hypothetical protein [Gammaproteobacteria bacterium]